MREKETLVEVSLQGVDQEVGAALWRLEDCRLRTQRALRGVRPEDIDQPVAGNTIGTILYHLALIEADWLYTEILEEEPPQDVKALLPADDRDEKGTLTAVQGQTMEQHLARLQAIRAKVLAALEPMTTDDLHRIRSLPDYDVSPAWVLHHLAQHEAEHRGELGSVIALLRAT